MLVVAAGVGALAATGGAAAVPPRVTVDRQLYLMGTRLTLAVEGVDAASARGGAEAAVAALERAEARLSTWRDDSELARLNTAPPGAAVTISAALAAELGAAVGCAESTGGAFDPAIGGLVDLWDLRGKGRVPAEGEIAAALRGARVASVALDGRRAGRLHAATRVEEGAWGKGAALDAALAALAARRGVTGAWLDLGGHAAVLGDGGSTATVADPSDRHRPVVAVDFAGGSLSTSGNGERRLVVDGRRIGHLLDPRTGRPAADFGSLTVWARSGLAADCLSTGLFVMGPDAALAWAAAHPEVQVLVLERRSDGELRARASSGLDRRVRPLVAGLEVTFDETPRGASAAWKNEGAVDRLAWQRGSTAP